MSTLARVTNDVLTVGWRNNGVDDNAPYAASLPSVSNVIGTEGDYRFDSAVTISKPLHVRAGARLIIGSTANVLIDAPFSADTLYGDVSIEVEPGGTIRFGQKSGVEIRARWFGAFPGMGEAGAAACTAAFNAFFRCYRDSNPTSTVVSRVGGLYIDRGEYWVNNFVWAGFDAGTMIRHYTLFAHDVTVWVTEHEDGPAGWGTSPVWDMTGAGIDNATVHGLRIRTKAGMAYADMPYIGLMLARFVNSLGKAVTSAKIRLHDVTVSGDFQLCPHFNFASEQTRYHDCDFENHHEQGRRPFINQETPYYAVTSEFADLPTTRISNGGLEFHGCHFDYNWKGDPELGGGLHFIGAKTPLFHGGWINPRSVSGVRGAVVRLTHDIANGGTRPHGLTLRNTLIHRTNEWILQVDGTVEVITLDGIKATPRRAVVKMSPGARIEGLTIKQRFGSIGSLKGIPFTVDPATDTFTVTDMPFSNNDEVIFSGGVAPGGTVLGTPYYIGDAAYDEDAGTGTFRLYAAVGGALKNITDAVNSSTINANWLVLGVDASGLNCDITDAEIDLDMPHSFNRRIEGELLQSSANRALNVFSGSSSFVRVWEGSRDDAGTFGVERLRNVKLLVSGTSVIAAEQRVPGWKFKNLPADNGFYSADYLTTDDEDFIVIDRDSDIVGWVVRSSAALTAGSIRVLPQVAPVLTGVDSAFASIATSKDLSAAVAGEEKQYTFTLPVPVPVSKGDRVRFTGRSATGTVPNPMPMVGATLILRPR